MQAAEAAVAEGPVDMLLEPAEGDRVEAMHTVVDDVEGYVVAAAAAVDAEAAEPDTAEAVAHIDLADSDIGLVAHGGVG